MYNYESLSQFEFEFGMKRVKFKLKIGLVFIKKLCLNRLKKLSYFLIKFKSQFVNLILNILNLN